MIQGQLPEPPNPSALCKCGCGQITPISPVTIRSRGAVKGQHQKFIRGHFSRTPEAKVGYESRKAKPPPPNPAGLCMCGCGAQTNLAKVTFPNGEQVKGHPLRFLAGHSPIKTGSANHKWKGGRWEHKSGYIYVHQPNHPFCNADGYVLEHRLILEQRLGRYLTKEEIGHHINHVRNDNRDDNLMLMDRKSHLSHHQPERTAAMQRPETKEKSSKAGKKGAAARWHKE